MSQKLHEMDILDHLQELRRKIIICFSVLVIFFVIAYIKSELLTSLLKSPLGNVDLIFITPVEGFITKIKIAFFGGLVISSPMLFLQTILFVSPGLYKKEKILLFLSLPFIIGLFFSGIFFCFKFILPTTLKYLMSFGNEHMQPMLSVGKYFNFVIMLTLALGVVFELPLVMLLLNKIGIINYKMLAKKRKYVMLMIVIITAVLTPTPDAFTLLAVALPLILLFEISLAIMFISSKISKPRSDKSEQSS